MTNESYQKALEAAQQELIQLVSARNGIDKRMAQLKTTISLLSALVEEAPTTYELPELGDVGITDAIRQLLKEQGAAMTPAGLKAKLAERDFDLDKYANAAAVIHNTLKRLEAQKEIVAVKTESGVTAYSMEPSFWGQLAGNFAEQLANIPESTRLAFELGNLPAIPVPQGIHRTIPKKD